MEAYANEHNLVDFEDPIPESAYVRSRFWNIWGFVKYCFDNSVNQNPYKVPKTVYVICVVMLAMAVVIKVWVVKQVSEHVYVFLARFGRKIARRDREKEKQMLMVDCAESLAITWSTWTRALWTHSRGRRRSWCARYLATLKQTHRERGIRWRARCPLW